MNKFYSFVFLTVLALALSGMAGNAANPDAIELEPMPRPVEMSSDMDAPVPFDEKTTVTVDCPDDAATAWLASHLRDWYGAFAPKVAAGACRLALRTAEFNPSPDYGEREEGGHEKKFSLLVGFSAF